MASKNVLAIIKQQPKEAEEELCTNLVKKTKTYAYDKEVKNSKPLYYRLVVIQKTIIS